MPDKNFFLKKSLLLVPMALLASLAVYQYRVINKGEKDLASIASQLNKEKEKNFNLLQKNQQAKVDKEILFQEIIKEKDVTSNFEMVKNNLLLSGEKVTMLENTTLDLNKKLSEFKSTNQELYQLNESILKHAEQVLSAQRENNRISAKILDENSQLLKRLESDKSSDLKFVNLNSSTYFVGLNNKQIFSNQAADVNFVNVNFKILKNPFFSANYIELYFQVIDSNGQVIFSNQIQNSLLKNQYYTEFKRVFYNNLELTVSQNIFLKKVLPGMHTVDIIYKDQVVLTNKVKLI